MGGLPGRARREGSRDRIGRSAGPEADQGARVNDDRFDPLKIVQALNHRGVEYVVIGGYAGELHAAAVPPTRDIDFTPRATAENLSRLSQVLTDLDARIRTEGIPDGLPFSHDGASLAAVGVWNLTCTFGELDISFKPSGTDGYEDLVRTALKWTFEVSRCPSPRWKTSSGPRKPPVDRKTSRPFLRCKNGSSHNRAPHPKSRQKLWLAGPRNVRLLTEPVKRLTRHSAR